MESTIGARVSNSNKIVLKPITTSTGRTKMMLIPATSLACYQHYPTSVDGDMLRRFDIIIDVLLEFLDALTTRV